ncbi:MAG: biotin/lipoyl-binding protein, partial [Myxococcales bacterium]|nr:biotin/lipoyl-binding protein [Myxococcales bacterium]
PQHPPTPEPLEIELVLANQRQTLLVHELGESRYLVGPNGALHVAHVVFEGAVAATLTLSDERHDVRYAYGDKGVTVEVDGAMHTVEPAAGGALKAPAPAMVVQVAVTEGERVAAGQRLLTLEAMKLEMPLLAAEAGVVKAVLCSANQQVNAGQMLILLEPEGTDTGAPKSEANLWQKPDHTRLQRVFSDEGVDLLGLDQQGEMEAAQTIGDLCTAMKSVMLGYDVSEAFATGLTHMLGGGMDFHALAHPHRWLPVVELLRCFVDVQRLFDRSLRHEEASATSDHSLFFEACRLHHEGLSGAPTALEPALVAALAWYGPTDDDAAYREALFRLHVAHAHGGRRHALCSLILRAAIELQDAGVDVAGLPKLAETLDAIARVADPKLRYVGDNARQAEYVFFAQPRYMRRQRTVQDNVDAALSAMDTAGELNAVAIDELATTSDSVSPRLLPRLDPQTVSGLAGVEVLIRRTFTSYQCIRTAERRSSGVLAARFELQQLQQHQSEQSAANEGARTATDKRNLAVILTPSADLPTALKSAAAAWRASDWDDEELELLIPGQRPTAPTDTISSLVSVEFGESQLRRITLSWQSDGLRLRTLVRRAGELVEDELLKDIHPEFARRFELHRLSGFKLERIDCPEPIYAFMGVAHDNPRDERIFAFAGVRRVPDLATMAADPTSLWELERAYYEGLRIIRETQARRAVRRRLHWNRITLYVRDPVSLSYEEICGLAHKLDGATAGLGLEKAVVRCQLKADSDGGSAPEWLDTAIILARPGKHRLQVSSHAPTDRPVRAMSDYAMAVVRARRLGMIYPYELIRTLTGERSGTDMELAHPDLRSGQFIEYDLDPSGNRLMPVDRAYGHNTAAVVVGTIRNATEKYPQGMLRVLIVNDPTQAMCALAEPECRRVLGALALARRLGVPVEWVATSAGARIAMDSGTENLDWTARVLRGLVEFTQDGGVIHVIVGGVNVGAQSYWNAEATMLMHTRGLLIMTADGSCVLTGKKALEVSGSVAAEDERGIGGWERVMGPNGQAQLFARDLGEAYHILMEHYRFTWRQPGETQTRRHPTADPNSRDICRFPYQPGGRAPEDAGEFETVGEIFSTESNPGRKKPFDVRAVMSAVIDGDGGHLERFGGMSEGETAVIWDAHVGGFPVCMVGFESRPLRRRGRIPTDGPDTWTGGTLFPQASKKVARAINAASGNRPVVVLANLSGFDGSPESLRRLQLEYGAEIGRAVVNFDGPIVFVVIGRYHGGAYVVFSKALNPQLTALALKGSYASVIGGGPAAAVVFPRAVRARAARDHRIVEAKAAMKTAAPNDKPRLRERFNKISAQVQLEVQGQVAEEFDAIHTVERAVQVGSLDAVIEPSLLRPTIVERLEAAAQGGAQERDAKFGAVQA